MSSGRALSHVHISKRTRKQTLPGERRHASKELVHCLVARLNALRPPARPPLRLHTRKNPRTPPRCPRSSSCTSLNPPCASASPAMRAFTQPMQPRLFCTASCTACRSPSASAPAQAQHSTRHPIRTNLAIYHVPLRPCKQGSARAH